jgi:hypothetical protein
VLVQRARAGQQLGEALAADGDGNRQADGRPERKAPTHAFVEAQAAARAEGGCRGRVGADGNEAARHLAPALRHEPVARRLCVAQGLGRAEGLGGDDEQGARGLQRRQHGGQLVAVHVGDEVQARPVHVAAGAQRLHHHARPQIGAADADVHHVGDAGIRPHGLGQLHHLAPAGLHLGRYVNYVFDS